MSVKIGNIDISYFKVGGADCSIYLGDVKMYPQQSPSFEGKYKLTLSDSSVVSAECDATSAITSEEVSSQYSGTVVSAEIGDCVTAIAQGAFRNCRSLTSIDIPSGVVSIDTNAFNSCRSLTSIDIPDSVTSIDGSAFQGCTGLTSITIPSGVTSIGLGAFNSCSSLTSITVNATTPPRLGSRAFNGSTCPIFVPNVDAYKAASGWSTYADRIQAIV